MRHKQVALQVCAVLAAGMSVHATSYYVDDDGGNDNNPGISPEQAWATLERVSAHGFGPGDQILLQAGDTFQGKILLNGDSGTSGAPIVVASYGDGARPVVNVSGYLAAVHIQNAEWIEVRGLEITGDGGVMVDGSPEGERHGILINQSGSNYVRNILIEDLYIHDVYPSIGSEHEGCTPTTHLGYGVTMRGGDLNVSQNITVKECRIERVGFMAIEMKQVSFVNVLDNQMQDIGGPAIQPGRVNDLVVRGNVVHKSGSYIDPRMHGRGSGIWPWTSERVLIEKNIFTGARGRADSCGIHIDFNCRDVVVQYNLSIDNAGGFVEILGNNYNCTYRYNISINDGSRVKGEIDQGTIPNSQDGHIIWISGFVGRTQDGPRPPNGPFNNYIYNNTIYVKSDIKGTFSIQDTCDGLYVANNIFYVEGETEDITGNYADNYTQDMVDRVVWKNNLYQRIGIVPTFYQDQPTQPSFTDIAPRYGDPLFANAGGLNPEDYIPQAAALIAEQGITIENIPGDDIGLRVGFAVTEDFFGNPILGQPDMGAVEIGGTPPPLPDAAFNQPPTPEGKDSVSMESVGGPLGTQYYFMETSGNIGGSDSGWIDVPFYSDNELLPNTAYRYTVTLRDIVGTEGLPSDEVKVLTPKSLPFLEQVILDEDFSGVASVENSSAPFAEKTWYINNSDEWNMEGQSNSADITANGEYQTGWGYDEVVTNWYSSESLRADRDYQFTGEWKIANVLDVHLGQVVGLGEFDASTGILVKRIKEITVGELETPEIDMAGSFSLTIFKEEIQAANITPGNRVGVFLHHDDDGVLGDDPNTLRNDVYLLDNLKLVIPAAVDDLDGDGIPDTEEPALGLNPNDTGDGAMDLDGDGFSNFAEYLTGTNLNDTTEYFATGLSLNESFPEVILNAANILPGRLYIVEHSKSLGIWVAMDYLIGSIAAPDTDYAFQLAGLSLNDFFRIRVEWE